MYRQKLKHPRKTDASVGSYVVLGDWFFDYRFELARLRGLFAVVEEKPTRGLGGKYRLLVLSEPR